MAKKKQKKKGTSTEEVGFLNPQVRLRKSPGYVIAELRHDSQIAYGPSGFAGPAAVGRTYGSLNQVLSGFKVKRIESHFDMKAGQILKRSTTAPNRLGRKVTSEFAQSGFVRITPRTAKDAEALVKRLNRSKKAVWKAVLAPQLVPAGAPTGSSTTSRNFEPSQGYLHSAPNGISAMEAWAKYGCKGRGVTVCDIEGN